MKYIKKAIIILIILVLLFLLVLILDYTRLNISYIINKKNYTEVFDVQGNTLNYVPQGLCYSEKYNIVLQTSYNSKHNVSMLYVIDFETGKLLKELKLIEIDDTNNIKHVGGITTDDTTVWITNDYELNEYSLDEIINTENDFVKTIYNIKLPNRGDFCMYNKINNYLYIGDFFLNPFYPVPDDNPLLMCYSAQENIDFTKPDYIISLPIMVQGMAITDNNEFVFTSSFTPFIKSNLSIYNNVLEEIPEKYNLNGVDIPYYKFSKSNLIKNIKLPPMAEGIFYINNELYILFENSSNTYFYAFPKLKKIIKLNI